MFRKPRETSTPDVKTALKPSTGRPPTPPSSDHSRPVEKHQSSQPAMASPSVPLLGASKTTPRGNGRSSSGPLGKGKGKPNGSILNFFKKAESPVKVSGSVDQEEESLFFEDDTSKEGKDAPTLTQTPTPPRDNHPHSSTLSATFLHEETRYNETGMAVKRRRMHEAHPAVPVPKNNLEGDGQSQYFANSQLGATRTSNAPTSTEQVQSPSPSDAHVESLQGLRQRDSFMGPSSSTSTANERTYQSGPFIDDPDSKDEMRRQLAKEAFGISELSDEWACAVGTTELTGKAKEPQENIPEACPTVPTLKHESTSIVGGDGFEGIEDFIEDEFPEDGEEYMERRWVEEQRHLELGLEEEDEADDILDTMKEEDAQHWPLLATEPESCPLCNASLVGVNNDQALIHVNHCLDGNPIPLPKSEVSEKAPSTKHESGISSHKRFQRAAVAKPGQDNPFTFGSSSGPKSTAFSKIMSSHAEDAAWATAAASETAARGKPAYQRTCPFYKILPGFLICVDAFRYGAVEGCNAYFLSHFHSDHYIGLTSSWCHGPIYCSHVTANLVRRQLRVDPKWVVDLEFDARVEVPGTRGVQVTMIPANHCPGSSLYLFEKVIGKGQNPKMQRVLHCGDFRACPAHVQHPLLRPDVLNIATGKSIGQQKLDVCYLDTTYLTPKYAFPSQEEVIKACADMCVSLSKDRVDETDDWEQSKKDRAGSGMVKFVRKNSEVIKEAVNEDDVDALKVNTKSGQNSRGRLLVIVGTYSIGKERICLGVARALNSKIYAPPNKQKICAALEDPELTARLTSDPLEAQVHMQMLMEIRAETLADYLTGFKPHFSRIVGFRPSGWNYRPPNSRFVESPAVQTVLHSDNWKSRYSMAELVPQRGSTREASCFGVPYSEHSSFRELTMFCCALRIDKIIPTVNVGSAKSREKMKAWCEKWAVEKKKNGLFKVADGQTAW